MVVRLERDRVIGCWGPGADGALVRLVVGAERVSSALA